MGSPYCSSIWQPYADKPGGTRLCWAAAGLVAWLAVACDGCHGCRDDTLAVLQQRQGTVSKQTGGTASAWDDASRGSRFALGDALRTGRRSNAELSFFPDGRMRVEQETVVRFLDAPPTAPRRLALEQGAVALTAVTEPIDIDTGHGLARLRQGSRATVRRQADAVVIDVRVGRVVALARGHSAAAGERLVLDVGAVVAEPIPEATADAGDARVAAAPANSGAGGAAPANSGAGGAAVPAPQVGKSPNRAGSGAVHPAASAVPGVRFAAPGRLPDLVLTDQGTVTVHAPDPPVWVGLPIDPCPGPAAFEIRAGSAVARRTVRAGPLIAELASGDFRYSCRCTGDPDVPTHKGRLRVRADPGIRRLPQIAPSADIDADGRRYTVRYQHRLPSLRFRWPDAPPSDSYRIELAQGTGPARRLPEHKAPEITLASGALPEGTHRFRMVTAGGRTSKEGVVRIVFDHGAPTAYLSAPGNRDFSRAQAVWVRGAALTGSVVQAGNLRIPVGEGGRFSGKVTMESGRAALAIRVHQRHNGTHYYLRYPADPASDLPAADSQEERR